VTRRLVSATDAGLERPLVSRGLWTSQVRAFILAVAAASTKLILKLNEGVEMTESSGLAVPKNCLMESKYDCYD
jgi:hypothetical protein